MILNSIKFYSFECGVVRMQNIMLPISGKYSCQPLYGPHFLLIRNEAGLTGGCPGLGEEDDPELDVVEKPESESEFGG